MSPSSRRASSPKRSTPSQRRASLISPRLETMATGAGKGRSSIRKLDGLFANGTLNNFGTSGSPAYWQQVTIPVGSEVTF